LPESRPHLLSRFSLLASPFWRKKNLQNKANLSFVCNAGVKKQTQFKPNFLAFAVTRPGGCPAPRASGSTDLR
jgi:hypothetical protein